MSASAGPTADEAEPLPSSRLDLKPRKGVSFTFSPRHDLMQGERVFKMAFLETAVVILGGGYAIHADAHAANASHWEAVRVFGLGCLALAPGFGAFGLLTKATFEVVLTGMEQFFRPGPAELSHAGNSWDALVRRILGVSRNHQFDAAGLSATGSNAARLIAFAGVATVASWGVLWALMLALTGISVIRYSSALATILLLEFAFQGLMGVRLQTQADVLTALAATVGDDNPAHDSRLPAPPPGPVRRILDRSLAWSMQRLALAPTVYIIGVGAWFLGCYRGPLEGPETLLGVLSGPINAAAMVLTLASALTAGESYWVSAKERILLKMWMSDLGPTQRAGVDLLGTATSLVSWVAQLRPFTFHANNSALDAVLASQELVAARVEFIRLQLDTALEGHPRLAQQVERDVGPVLTAIQVIPRTLAAKAEVVRQLNAERAQSYASGASVDEALIALEDEFPGPGWGRYDGGLSVTTRPAALLLCLRELLVNALVSAEASGGLVRLRVSSDDFAVSFILENGSTAAPLLLNHLGRPGNGLGKLTEWRGRQIGMGMGWFLTRTAARLSGGDLVVTAREDPAMNRSHIVSAILTLPRRLPPLTGAR